ncbi:MAG TPA: YceI family protein [Patescibacteria group bacterium]|nr:YceI family protein [Patescibacteria group bacterium]
MSTWQFDTAHTVVSFSAKHMMITKVRGIFKGVSGTIDYDEADPARSSVEVTIPAATVETGMEPRDNHLRSADFLDAEAHPTLAFVSSGIAPRGGRWAITGDLTIRGVARPVVLDAAPLGVVTGMDGRRHAGFEATTRIRRSDWGLTWNIGLEAGGWLVSDEISIDLEVAADEVAAAHEVAAAA